MEWTPFAGLTALDENDPITVDGASFLVKNPRITDHLLQVGAVSHRHDAHAALPNPHVPVTASAVSGGALPASGTYAITYTVIDQFGGETKAAPAVTVVTGGLIPTPTIAPTAAPNYASGIMPAGSYYYALTYVDGMGGETPIGPSTYVYVDPGYASASVDLSGLTAEFATTGAVAWRLWRSYEGADWHLVTQGDTDTFVDDGFDPPDNPARPPAGNTTNQTYAIEVRLPSAGADPALASGSAIKVYLAPDTNFIDPCFYAEYPIASAGSLFEITQAAVSTGSPPHVSTSLPGAQKINPDTDILDWHWKRPVANAAALPTVGNEDGDTRVTLDNKHIHIWDVTSSAWIEFSGGGGGGAADPAGSALGILRVDGPTGVTIAASTTTHISIPVPTWAEQDSHRLVVALAVTHPDPSHLAATLTSAQGDPARLFVAGSFDSSGANIGYPPGASDPDNLLYFSDSEGNFETWGNSEQLTPSTAAPTYAGRRYIPVDTFQGSLIGDGNLAGTWDLAFTDTAGASGTVASVVLYFVSTEFDALIDAPPQVLSGNAFLSDGGTIAHGISGFPSYISLTGTASGSVITGAVDATHITVAIKNLSGGSGPTQQVYWSAKP